VEWTVAVVTTSDVFLFSCSEGHLEIVRLLIVEFNCDAQCTDHARKTPLHYACRYVPFLVLIGKKSTFICATKKWKFHDPEIA